MANPKVEIRSTASNGALAKHVAWCHEPGCGWVYVNSVKTDVQDQARYHRAEHRHEAAAGGAS